MQFNHTDYNFDPNSSFDYFSYHYSDPLDSDPLDSWSLTQFSQTILSQKIQEENVHQALSENNRQFIWVNHDPFGQVAVPPEGTSYESPSDGSTPVSNSSSDALDTVFEAMKKWLEQPHHFPDQKECFAYFEGMFTTFKKESEMMRFFNLFCHQGLISVFLAEPKSNLLSFSVDYNGTISANGLNEIKFKKLNLIAYFVHFFRSHPLPLISSFKEDRTEAKQLLSLIWASQLGKIGMTLLLECLPTHLKDPAAIRKGSQKIFPPQREYNKTALFKLNSELNRAIKNSDILLIPNDEFGQTFMVYPSHQPYPIGDVIKSFLFSQNQFITILKYNNKLNIYGIEAINLSNNSFYNFLINDHLFNLSPSLEFIKLNYACIKEESINYLNSDKLNLTDTLRLDYILKIYLACCFFEWKEQNPPPSFFFQLTKEGFLSKVQLTKEDLQAKAWHLYSFNILTKGAVNSSIPVSDFKSALLSKKRELEINPLEIFRPAKKSKKEE